MYDVRCQKLALLEEQSRQGTIDLYYGDESRVCEQGYVPYGWQFADEIADGTVAIASIHGQHLNCFGLLSRNNTLHFQTTTASITADFILDFFDRFSLTLAKPTVVVLDNARLHTARKIKERITVWQKRDLFLFFLPPYSPQLNIIERLWKELKARWLRPEDYRSPQCLFYATWLALSAVGESLTINFSPFKY